jgi:hypothetical protein
MTYRIELAATAKADIRGQVHRIIFTLRQDTVYVLYVRHTAHDELEP